MSKQTISIGRIFGIPIGLDTSWFLAFVLITWTLAVSYYPAEFKNWPIAEYWLVSAATTILFFGSVLLHEVGHSIVALQYKIPVRRITLFIFGGVAEIGAEPPSAKVEFWIAITGPLVSFGLAILFSLLQPALAAIPSLFAMAKYLALTNGSLALFNMIPGFPLDGGRVFRAMVWKITNSWRRATSIAANVGRFIGFLFVLFGVWLIFRSDLINGLWIAFIGWFLESAASSQLQQLTTHDRLAGHKVSEMMRQGYASVPADANLQDVVYEEILNRGQRCVIVEQDHQAVGLLTPEMIKEVPRNEWAKITAAQAMLPMSDVKRVQPDSELWDALEEMDRDSVNQLPVMADDRCVGMLSRENLIGYLRTQGELGQ
jgi:Zn-dependent protease/CBS domain-containing protein